MKWSFVIGCLSLACVTAGLGLGSACVYDCTDDVLPMLSLRLTDESTGQPVCDANVRAYRAGRSASSAVKLDVLGCVYEQHSPSGLGRYIVEVGRQGYFPLTFDYNVTRKNDNCDKILTERLDRSLRRDPSQPLELDAGLGD